MFRSLLGLGHPYVYSSSYPYIRPSICPYLRPPIHSSKLHVFSHLTAYVLIHPSVHPLISKHISVDFTSLLQTAFYVTTHPCIRPPTRQFISPHPSIHPSIRPSIRPSIHPYIHSSIHPYYTGLSLGLVCLHVGYHLRLPHVKLGLGISVVALNKLLELNLSLELQ